MTLKEQLDEIVHGEAVLSGMLANFRFRHESNLTVADNASVARMVKFADDHVTKTKKFADSVTALETRLITESARQIEAPNNSGLDLKSIISKASG